MSTIESYVVRRMALVLALAGMLAGAPHAVAFQGRTAAATEMQDGFTGQTHRTIAAETLMADLTRKAPEPADADRAVDLLINPPPKNAHLFRVGRMPRPEPSGNSERPVSIPDHTASNAGTDREAGGNTHPGVSEAADDWIQMDLDQNGTYLFFDDSVEAEEMLNLTEPQKLLEYGVGIGKRWHV